MSRAGLTDGGRPRPRVYVHVGEPKTGTTFLQDTLWANRAVLSERGVVLPGYNRRDHSRASRDLRDAPRDPSDFADPWAGEWDVLAGQALHARSAAVISDEVLAACTPAQADRAVRSLSAAEVHLVVTVRELSALLPAEWQETVKCRGTLGWDSWLRAVVEATPAADRRTRSLFWALHDTVAILRMWSRHIPPDRVHVITTPRRVSPEVLWTRFASVLGITAAGIDLGRARTNASLGFAETEFLRRVNEQLPASVPDWFYTRNIKRVLAHGVLCAQPADTRQVLPPGLQPWARQQSELMCTGLRDIGCEIVGDLSELLPGPAGQAGGAGRAGQAGGSGRAGQAGGSGRAGQAGGAARAGQAAVRSIAAARQPAGLVDAAVLSAAALASQLYEQVHPVRRRHQPVGGPRRALSRLEWAVLHAPSAQRVLRRGSHLGWVRRVRVAIWCVLMRPGRQHAHVPVRPARVLDAGGVSRAA